MHSCIILLSNYATALTQIGQVFVNPSLCRNGTAEREIVQITRANVQNLMTQFRFFDNVHHIVQPGEIYEIAGTFIEAEMFRGFANLV